MTRLPPDLKEFVDKVQWTFAKTYAKTWPHNYIVRDKVDKAMFMKIVKHIRENGYWGDFYQTKIKYFEEDGMVYWTMVPPEGDSEWYPIEEEDIINRCPKENTYESRLKNGTIPA